MRQIKQLIVGIVIMGLCLACQSNSSTVSSDKTVLKSDPGINGKIIHVGNGSDPEYLDPGLVTGAAGVNIVVNLFEGLTDFDHKTLEPKPAIATHWNISPNGKLYTFHLRKNAKWSDGSAVTAHDFVYSWQRVVNPITASRYAYIMYFVKNAHAINTGKITDLSQLGIRAVDDYTLLVTLENATPFFPSLVAWHTYRPVKKEVIEAHAERWTLPEHFVGNGYFKITEWVPQKQISIEPNDHYWDKQFVYLDKVVFHSIEDSNTELKKYLKGELHYIFDVPNVKKEELRKTRSDYFDVSKLATYALNINIKKPPLDNKKVRQALAYAIDREKLVEVIDKGIANASYTPKGIGSYNPPNDDYFQPEKARALLRDAGYENGKGMPKITLYYNTNENHKMIMQVIQNMWKRHLNINVALLNMEWKVLLKTKANKDFQMIRAGWIGDYADPNTFLDMFMTDSSQNATNWSNIEYDTLIKKSMQTLDRDKRNQYFYEAETILLDDVPMIALFTNTASIMYQGLENFHSNFMNVHPFKYVKKK